MALVRMRWLTTVEYGADVEVEAWTGPDDDEDGTLDVQLADLENDDRIVGVSNREVTSTEVLRAGDSPALAAHLKAPAHDPEWGDGDPPE